MSVAGASSFVGTSLPFQIRVTEGRLAQATLQTGQPPGVIQLAAWSAPFRPIEFGGTMRAQTTFYPGNPNASQLPIGSTEKPTTVTGEWNDKYLGDGQAQALADLLDSIRLAGVSVEVTWPLSALGGSPSSPVLSGNANVRVGLITDFTYRYLYAGEDIGWSCEFTWRSRGAVTAPAISATGTINAREGFSDVALDLALTRATGQALLEGPTVAPLGIPQAAQRAFDNAFAAVDSVVGAVTQVTGAITSATLIPAAAATQLINSCTQGVQSCLNMVDNIESLNLLTMEVTDSALDLLRLVDSLFTTKAQADKAGETCYDAALGVQQQVLPDVIATVTAPAGTDLRDLAIRYYGTPDGWMAIAQANDIVGSAVPAPPTGPSDQPNRPLVIPRLVPGSATDVSAQC